MPLGWGTKYKGKLKLREDILTTLRRMEPCAERMGGLPALEHLYLTTHTGSDASFLRQQYAKHGSLESTVDAAIQRFRDGYPTLSTSRHRAMQP